MPRGIYIRTKPAWNKGKEWSKEVKEKIRKKTKGKHNSIKSEWKKGDIKLIRNKFANFIM